MITLEITCPFCGRTSYVKVEETDYLNWRNGDLAQDCFPYLSATEREQLISCLCPSCQASIFGEEEEEDADACMRESLEFTGQWW